MLSDRVQARVDRGLGWTRCVGLIGNHSIATGTGVQPRVRLSDGQVENTAKIAAKSRVAVIVRNAR